MAVTNVSWGEERIAHELLVKLGVRVSRARWESTCRVEMTATETQAIHRNAGPHSFAITRRQSSPASRREAQKDAAIIFNEVPYS